MLESLLTVNDDRTVLRRIIRRWMSQQIKMLIRPQCMEYSDAANRTNLLHTGSIIQLGRLVDFSSYIFRTDYIYTIENLCGSLKLIAHPICFIQNRIDCCSSSMACPKRNIYIMCDYGMRIYVIFFLRQWKPHVAHQCESGRMKKTSCEFLMHNRVCVFVQSWTDNGFWDYS